MSRAPAANASIPAAIPSSSVDLPQPFSPTRNVTGVVNANASRSRTSGSVQGKRPRSRTASGRRRSADRKTIEISHRFRAGFLRQQNVVGLIAHSLQPPLDIGEPGEIKAAFACDVGIGIQCNVGDGVSRTAEPACRGEMRVHYRKYLRAAPVIRLDLARPVIGASIDAQEAVDRDCRLM